ncbi:hypothetical protein [Konateibacter massiliensis]|uniref:hypothetical protein n=1 Tax=Konateibacter massiliensis TaxID=2002841 RepID=UPI000C14D05C|nr:hypothetical protein [Konateibacter massiliensis]
MRKNIRGYFIILLLELCLLMSVPQTVFAISSADETTITPTESGLKEWSDGAVVTKETSGKGEEYQVDVTADTTGLDEDYYSVYIYDYKKRNIGTFDGIRFHYVNNSDNDVKINLTLTVDADTSVMMLEKSFAVAENDETKKTEVLSAEYGTIAIPAHFSGTIYVPFTQLFDEEGENVSLKTIQSWGITTVVEKEQQVSYSIGNIAFLEGSVELMRESCFLITLSGEKTVLLPSTGSVLWQYEGTTADLEGQLQDADLSFFMEEDIDGVTLSADGALEIQSGCTEPEITIYAKTEQSVNAGKLVISLEHVSTDVAAVGVPSAGDVEKITSTAYTTLNNSVIFFRILGFVLALFFLAVFSVWFSEAKTNYEKMKKKLYQIFHEEDEKGL